MALHDLLPDRFPGGIIGAFLSANGGAVLAGVISQGFSRPPLADVRIGDAAVAFVGAVLGLAGSYYWGARLSRRAGPPGT